MMEGLEEIDPARTRSQHGWRQPESSLTDLIQPGALETAGRARGAIVAGCSAMVVSHITRAAIQRRVRRTSRLPASCAAAKLLEIELLDHVIIGHKEADPQRRGVYSFRAAGLK
jgi:hypothetical protein